MGKERDNKLLFRDMLITHTDQWFSTCVYKKKNNFHRTIHQLQLPPSIKWIVRCLQHRSKAISSNDVYLEEMDRLKVTLHRNNYPRRITSAPRNLDHRAEDRTRKLSTFCPMSKAGLKKNQKVCSLYKIRTTFRNCSTLHKHPLRKKKTLLNIHDKELYIFHPMQLWQSIHKRDMQPPESMTIGISKIRCTRRNRKVRYGWPYIEKWETTYPSATKLK